MGLLLSLQMRNWRAHKAAQIVDYSKCNQIVKDFYRVLKLEVSTSS